MCFSFAIFLLENSNSMQIYTLCNKRTRKYIETKWIVYEWNTTLIYNRINFYAYQPAIDKYDILKR